MKTKITTITIAVLMLAFCVHAAQQVITPGAAISLAAGRNIINANFGELYGAMAPILANTGTLNLSGVTIGTGLNGLLKGNGTTIAVATAGTDYEVPITFGSGLTRTVNTVGINATAGIQTFLATPTSANFVSAITGEVGTGPIVCATNPVFGGTVNMISCFLNVARVNGTYVGTGGTLNIENTAVGLGALQGSMAGADFNTAIGSSALSQTSTGTSNTAVGTVCLLSNTTGSRNTAIGRDALWYSTTGDGNVAIGYWSGFYETGSDSFYLNNRARADLTGDQTLSLLYGKFGDLASDQQLTANVGGFGVGGAPDANAILDAQSTTKAFIPPRMTKAQRNAIASPVAGMTIYQTDNTPGQRVYNGTNWMAYTETAD